MEIGGVMFRYRFVALDTIIGHFKLLMTLSRRHPRPGCPSIRRKNPTRANAQRRPEDFAALGEQPGAVENSIAAGKRAEEHVTISVKLHTQLPCRLNRDFANCGSDQLTRQVPTYRARCR